MRARAQTFCTLASLACADLLPFFFTSSAYVRYKEVAETGKKQLRMQKREYLTGLFSEPLEKVKRCVQIKGI
jgi:hypothetical protein